MLERKKHKNKHKNKKTRKDDISEFLDLNSKKTLKTESTHSYHGGYHGGGSGGSGGGSDCRTGYINSNKTQTGGGGDYTTTQKTFGRVIKGIPEQLFIVKNKKEYAQLARDVRATWIRLAIGRKLGSMEEKDYLMFKSLLYANLHFARMSLYYERMNQLTIILNKGPSSLIEVMRAGMDTIFAYQEVIQNQISLQSGKSGFKYKDVKKAVKEQEKARAKLMEAFVFKNSYDLMEGCEGVLAVSKKKSNFFVSLVNIAR